MSVIAVNNNNGGLLGTLGSLATLAGGFAGVPMLGALGSGMSAVNSAMNGDALGTAQALGGFNNAGGLSQILSGLGNLFGTNNTGQALNASANKAQQFGTTYNDLANKWDPRRRSLTYTGWL